MTPYSQETYRLLIGDAITEGFRFASFLDAEPSEPEGVIYLRHDVDFSLAMAVELGRINAALGVSGTFFVLLRGHAYNPASERSQQRMEELIALGQRLAFHWGVRSHGGVEYAFLDEYVRAEFELAQQIIPAIDPVVAVHTPTQELLQLCTELNMDSLVNANSSHFTQAMPYYSDSNLRYTVEEWRGIVKRGEPRIQVLLHPVNWIAGGSDMLEVLRNCWSYLLAEAEAELRLNGVWSTTFTDGLPERARQEFVAALHQPPATP